MSDFGASKGKRSKFGQFKPRRTVKPEKPLDYKDVEYLSKFIGPTGKLQSRRRTSFDGQDQRKLAKAVKLSRFMGLLPFVGSMHGDLDRDAGGGRDRFPRGRDRGERGGERSGPGRSDDAGASTEAKSGDAPTGETKTEA